MIKFSRIASPQIMRSYDINYYLYHGNIKPLTLEINFKRCPWRIKTFESKIFKARQKSSKVIGHNGIITSSHSIQIVFIGNLTFMSNLFWLDYCIIYKGCCPLMNASNVIVHNFKNGSEDETCTSSYSFKMLQ